MKFGANVALFQAWHTIIKDYVPFIILLLSLFTVAGGVRLRGSLAGTPAVNTGILLCGTILASWMGTTGAAMLFIRPVLRANAHRRYRVHQVVFFIFLVANIGGSLTPLGDPPLFLGFLNGVEFFWTTLHVLPETTFMVAALLIIFFGIDSFLYAREGRPSHPAARNGETLGLDGGVNILLLLGIVVMVLLSGSWQGSGIELYHVSISAQNLVRDISLLVITALSVVLTNRERRRLNGFTWNPILEVGKLFFGIFISMIPAIAILQSGEEGALGGVIRLVSNSGQPVNAMYFWMTGALSSFLDNAPTYLVFLNTAGGNAAELMHTMPGTLTAISIGAVFMGANTYIGNAPNFMVRSIAIEHGVKMPSFFGYMAWSFGVLIPLFILLTFIFL